MTGAMASVLTPGVLTVAELCSARLDGELFAVDEAFAPVDEAESAWMRAGVLRGVTGGRLTAELDSALWVRGVVARAPSRHTMCVARSNRLKFAPSPRIAVREMGHEPGDVEVIAGLCVTMPGRILFDLALLDGEERARDAVALMLRFPEIVEPCVRRVDEARSVPGKLRGEDRLRRWRIGAEEISRR